MIFGNTHSRHIRVERCEYANTKTAPKNCSSLNQLKSPRDKNARAISQQRRKGALRSAQRTLHNNILDRPLQSPRAQRVRQRIPALSWKRPNKDPNGAAIVAALLTVLAVALEGLVDEGAVVVRIDPEDRHRQVSPGDFQPFDDERLLGPPERPLRSILNTRRWPAGSIGTSPASSRRRGRRSPPQGTRVTGCSNPRTSARVLTPLVATPGAFAPRARPATRRGRRDDAAIGDPPRRRPRRGST
jgi:hypothetical protein